jgi:hypothetical protein
VLPGAGEFGVDVAPGAVEVGAGEAALPAAPGLNEGNGSPSPSDPEHAINAMAVIEVTTHEASRMP